MIRFLLVIVGVGLCESVSAQFVSFETIVKDRMSRDGLSDVQLYFVKQKQVYSTDDSGYCKINRISAGEHVIRLIYHNELFDSVQVSIGENKTLPFIIWVGKPSEYSRDQSERSELIDINNSSLVTEDPSSLQEEDLSPEWNIVNTVFPAPSLTAFAHNILSQYNFRPRAYGREEQYVFINNVLVNDLFTGHPGWNDWSGLTDIFRQSSSSYGLAIGDMLPSGLYGRIHYDLDDMAQQIRTRCAYSFSNRTYRHRIQITHSARTARHNWVYQFSLSKRWASEGYLPGSMFDANAAYFSLAKTWSERNRLSIMLIASQYRRAGSSPATEEVYQLSGTPYYNPNWGWQNGQKRNARLQSAFLPILQLCHVYHPAEKRFLQTTVAYQSGSRNSSGLDWYQAPDPRADYYRNLPSYFTDNPEVRQNLRNVLQNDPDRLQINWQNIYRANVLNRQTLHQVNGNPDDSLSGRQALYVIGADRIYTRKISIASTYLLSRRSFEMSMGIHAVYQSNTYSRYIEDLLGADYFVNFNQFAAQAYPGYEQARHYDLLHKNQALGLGDLYRYNYNLRAFQSFAWYMLHYQWSGFRFSTDIQTGIQIFRRTGHMQHGLFPDNSLGTGPSFLFPFYRLKAGITYARNFYNHIFLRMYCAGDAPDASQIWVSPRLHHVTTPGLTLQKTEAVETGFRLGRPQWQLQLLGYISQRSAYIQIQRFYNDDPSYASFVNLVLTGIQSRNIGLEWQARCQLNHHWRLEALANIGQSFYTNQPRAFIYSDNDTAARFGEKQIFLKNYYLGAGPQSAYVLGVEYESSRHWFTRLTLSCFDRNYVSINPLRRTEDAAELLTPQDPLFARIFTQERLSSFYTIDMFLGKSFLLRRSSNHKHRAASCFVTLGISNLLNRQDIRLLGYEQLRYDFENNDPDKFPNKYMYALGRTFFANISLKL